MLPSQFDEFAGFPKSGNQFSRVEEVRAGFRGVYLMLVNGQKNVAPDSIYRLRSRFLINHVAYI